MLFLENTLNEQIETTSLLEDATGLINVTLETEMAWNEMTMNQIGKEYTAIKESNKMLLEEASKGYFETAKEKLAELFKKIASAIKNLIMKITSHFVKVDKFLKMYDKELKGFNGSGDVKVKVHDIKNPDAVAALYGKVAGTFSGIIKNAQAKRETVSTDDICKAIKLGETFADMKKEIVKLSLSEKAEEKTLDKSMVAGAVKLLQNSKKEAGALKASVNAVKATINFAQATASKAAAIEGSNGDEGAKKGAKAAIETTKNCMSVYNKAISVATSCGNTAKSDAMKIVRRAIAEGRKNVKKESLDLSDLL